VARAARGVAAGQRRSSRLHDLWPRSARVRWISARRWAAGRNRWGRAQATWTAFRPRLPRPWFPSPRH